MQERVKEHCSDFEYMILKGYNSLEICSSYNQCQVYLRVCNSLKIVIIFYPVLDKVEGGNTQAV